MEIIEINKFDELMNYKKNWNFLFPDYFPAYRDVKFSDDKIYFITYKNVTQKDEVIITDLKGKFLRKTSIPADPYDRNKRFSIYKDKVYYLVENEGEEMFELHASDLN